VGSEKSLGLNFVKEFY